MLARDDCAALKNYSSRLVRLRDAEGLAGDCVRGCRCAQPSAKSYEPFGFSSLESVALGEAGGEGGGAAEEVALGEFEAGFAAGVGFGLVFDPFGERHDA